MKRQLRWLAVGLTVALLGGALVTTAYAQKMGGSQETGILTVTEPLDVGGTVLQPGDYQITVVPGSRSRDLVQVWNADRTELFTTLLTIPHHEGPSGVQVRESRYVYYPASADHAKALRTWFASNTPGSGGHDIVYPKGRAMELAPLADEPVIAIPDEVEVAEYETAPLLVVTPDAEVKPYEDEPAPTVVEEEPVRVAEVLPQTASNVPLYAGLGLLSLLGALVLGVLAKRLV
jgi:hypothetical protein